MWCKQFITHIILVAIEGLWHLGSLFYHDTQYSRGSFTNLLLCDIPQNKAPRTGPRHIWRTYRLFAFFGRDKNTNGTGDVWKISLTTLESHNICCGCTWFSNQSGGGAILALSSFLNQIPHQKEPEISVGIFSPT